MECVPSNYSLCVLYVYDSAAARANCIAAGGTDRLGSPRWQLLWTFLRSPGARK